jgi:hypothetical protein
MVLRRFQCNEAVNGFSFGNHKKNRSWRMQSLRGRVPKGLNMRFDISPVAGGEEDFVWGGGAADFVVVIRLVKRSQ